MPFSKWPENVLREVISLQEERNIQVLIAHIERYARYQGRGVLDTLWEHGIRFQVNAEALTNWRTVRFVRRLLEKDRLHVLGSDSHNLTTRQPNLGQALSFLEEKYGVETIKHLRDNAVQMLTPTIAYPRGNP